MLRKWWKELKIYGKGQRIVFLDLKYLLFSGVFLWGICFER